MHHDVAATGSRLGRYQLRYRVAQGGMASVYLAQLRTQADFEKWVALKTIHPHIAEDPRFVQMFLDEARLAAKLDHPNICTVFDFGQADGIYYLAMEYLHGQSLERLARRCARSGGIPAAIAARIVCDAARGLHHAHELQTDDGRPAGVVHRDVSPQNIFVLYGGVTKVVDFGIARFEARAAEKTQTGLLKGKLPYMSPEQIRARDEVDRRTDLWALGVVLFEVTLGVRLFKRDNPGATLAAIERRPIVRPTQLRAGYPAELERIILRALSRDLAARYPTALELARDLERFIVAGGQPCTPEDVAGFMTSVFGEDLRVREHQLAKDAIDDDPEILEPPGESSVPELEGDETVSDETRNLEEASPRAPFAPQRAGWASRVAIVVASLGLLLAGFAAARLIDWSTPPTPAAARLPAERPAAREPVRRVRPERATVAPAVGPASADGPSVPVAPEGTPVAVRPETEPPRRREPSRAPSHPNERPPSQPELDGPRERHSPPSPSPSPSPPSSPSAPATLGDVGYGFVHISTTPPGLEVRRGGELLGRTPLHRRLRVGRHTLRLVTAEGVSREVDVDVRPGATALFSFVVR